jgi:nucleoside-diphosphate-sugar epimerase
VRCLITGVAGFVGSHLAERLLAQGREVVGIDCFTDYYARELKEQNLVGARSHRAFSLVEADIVRVDFAKLLDGVDVVYHQAAQAGVRASWGQTFESYTPHRCCSRPPSELRP